MVSKFLSSAFVIFDKDFFALYSRCCWRVWLSCRGLFLHGKAVVSYRRIVENKVPKLDGRYRQALSRALQEGPDEPQAARPVLAVEIASDVVSALPPNLVQPGAVIRSVTLHQLADTTLVGPAAPILVLSRLVTPEFDALDLARMLLQYGYLGRYLALVDRLPDAKLIRREVAAQSPGINFDVIILDGSSPLHSL